MAVELESLYYELKEIRVYLIKIGSSRRKGSVLDYKTNEANKIYERYTNCLLGIDEKIQSNKISVKDVSAIKAISEKIVALYNEILNLCKTSNILYENVGTESITMATFDLKTALSLLPNLTNDDNITKQLIDNIEYYDTVLKRDECKQNLINFVLKSRLSQVAKLKLNSNYSSVQALVQDMRSELLPKKAAPAIQNKMHRIRQNDLSVSDYGKELTELFVDLTISQANGNTDCYNTLKPINEKYAIKQFADGLRNRRLSTIISARNYISLKDAIQGAQDEEMSTASTSGEILGMSRYKSYNSNYRGSRSNFRGSRGGFNNKFSTHRAQAHSYGNQHRGWNQQNSPRHHGTRGRSNRGTFYNSRRNQGIRGQRSVHLMTGPENSTQNIAAQNPQPSCSNQFFRD